MLHAAVTPESSRQHLAFIHGLRGVAALLVVWAHLGSVWLATNHEPSILDVAYARLIVEPFRVFQNGGHLGVIIFFLVSGFIITYTSMREDRTSFAVKRILRLGPPLAVALVVCWLYVQIAHHYGSEPISVNDGGLRHWLSALFLLDGFHGDYVLGVTWTLSIEVIFYAMTFVLLGLTRRNPERSTWVLTGLWAVFTVLQAAVPPLRGSAFVSLPPYVGFLLVGRCIYLWRAELIRPIVAALNATLALVFFATFTERLLPGQLFGPRILPDAAPYYSYIYALVIFLGLMAAAPKRTIQPFTMLGDVSYSLYLLHIPVGFAVFEITAGSAIPNEVVTLIAIAAAIAAAWVSYRLVERPSQRLARRLLRHRTRRVVDVPAA
ncbi:acyltransferase family protein [Nocardioides sp. LHG3406-4]|uniref:acyltransferase family protein n=1 Tax=Nocardioides sp. LHG3406-4 TaxID=2804575 RepID=UPI003CED279B